MYKVIYGLILATLMFASLFNNVYAGCFHISPGTTCSQVSCGAVCCATPTECTNYQNSLPSNAVFCNGNNGINTAIGCIPISDTNSLASWLLGWAIGIGGGIAFLLIIYGSFMIMTSQGMPDRLKIGKEILTSAITGLVMLIFGVLLLNFIGFGILGLDKL